MNPAAPIPEPATAGERLSWWQQGVIYHIYPRSFADGNGDGIGDLRGLRDRLEHLRWLGVEALWLSPIYPSPMKDFGYDVTDHTAIDPRFGTLQDLDALIATAHGLGLRVLLDYVPNHTSDEHSWFAEARASHASAKRGWYLWRDPGPNGAPPNNWLSVFGGSAWTLDEPTGQCYYHAYLPVQPDLNWREPQVCEAMLAVLRFWLDRGVDGFRVDALRHLLKDPDWNDNPQNPDFKPGRPPYERLLPARTTDLDDVLGPISAMRGVLREYDQPGGDERVLLGELYVPIDRLMRYYGLNGQGVHLPSNMHLIDTAWRPDAIAGLVEGYEAMLPAHGWPNWVLGNHDRSRIASRVGAAQARVAAMLLLTLRGTPILYYGDEIGMRDVLIPPHLVQDPYEQNVPGLGLGRDPERTPMQWSGDPYAGFCAPDAPPWLPVADDFEQVNVAVQRRDPRSILNLHRRLLRLRRSSQALTSGSYRTFRAGAGVFAYVREVDGERLLIALNLTGEVQPVELDGVVRLSTRLDRHSTRVSSEMRLRPNEGAIVELAESAKVTD
jgi:alpha-glucosidase